MGVMYKMKTKRNTAIILAAGSGSRMKSDVKKQYLLLQEKPLIYYALNSFQSSDIIDDIIIVVSAEDMEYMRTQIVIPYGFDKVKTIVAGGKERYVSVANGLNAIHPDTEGICFIHDGARPFVTHEIIQRAYDSAFIEKACVVGMPVKDTIKISNETGFAVQTPRRSDVWMIQTPQVFETNLIRNCYKTLMENEKKTLESGIQITDDACVIELFSDIKVKLIEGSYQNIKITTPEDLQIAEAFIRL